MCRRTSLASMAREDGLPIREDATTRDDVESLDGSDASSSCHRGSSAITSVESEPSSVTPSAGATAAVASKALVPPSEVRLQPPSSPSLEAREDTQQRRSIMMPSLVGADGSRSRGVSLLDGLGGIQSLDSLLDDGRASPPPERASPPPERASPSTTAPSASEGEGAEPGAHGSVSDVLGASPPGIRQPWGMAPLTIQVRASHALPRASTSSHHLIHSSPFPRRLSRWQAGSAPSVPVPAPRASTVDRRASRASAEEAPRPMLSADRRASAPLGVTPPLGAARVSLMSPVVRAASEAEGLDVPGFSGRASVSRRAITPLMRVSRAGQLALVKMILDERPKRAALLSELLAAKRPSVDGVMSASVAEGTAEEDDDAAARAADLASSDGACAYAPTAAVGAVTPGAVAAAPELLRRRSSLMMPPPPLRQRSDPQRQPRSARRATSADFVTSHPMVHMKSRFGCTALSLAAEEGHAEIVLELLEVCAGPRRPSMAVDGIRRLLMTLDGAEIVLPPHGPLIAPDDP